MNDKECPHYCNKFDMNTPSGCPNRDLYICPIQKLEAENARIRELLRKQELLTVSAVDIGKKLEAENAELTMKVKFIKETVAFLKETVDKQDAEIASWKARWEKVTQIKNEHLFHDKYHDENGDKFNCISIVLGEMQELESGGEVPEAEGVEDVLGKTRGRMRSNDRLGTPKPDLKRIAEIKARRPLCQRCWQIGQIEKDCPRCHGSGEEPNPSPGKEGGAG